MKEAICPLMYANIQGTIASEPPSFGISLHTALLLWMVLNVPNEGPSGEKQILLLWMIMFLKDYSIGKNLSGQCGDYHKTFRVWVE